MCGNHVLYLSVRLRQVSLYEQNRKAKIWLSLLSKDLTISTEDFFCSAEFLYEQLTAFYLKFSFKANRYRILSPFLPQAGLH